MKKFFIPRPNSPTLYQITTLQEAFDLLNKTFFKKNELPSVIINQEHKQSSGYFSPERWKVKSQSNYVDEINLTPYLMGCDDKVIIAELLHQMVHHWQYHFGRPSRNGYHNRQWAEKMISVGLQPVVAGKAGKITGQKVSHIIIKDGPFDRLMNESFFQINYYSEKTTVDKKKNMVKYTCLCCGRNLWGKPGFDSEISCKVCKNDYITRKTNEEKETTIAEIVS